MTEQVLEAYRNARNRWDMQILDNGVGVDITGDTVILTAKWDPTDADSAAAFQLKSSVSGEITVTSASTGAFTTTLSASKTTALSKHRHTLKYDVRLIDNNGNQDIVSWGDFIVYPNITDSDS